MTLAERVARLEAAVAAGADPRRDLEVFRAQLARAEGKLLKLHQCEPRKT